jgi:ATP-dependent Lon protease
LDKVSVSSKGQDIINVLIHLTDPSQNNCFQDKYFSEIDLDLSKSLIIFTYNDNTIIDPILKDRMITIHTKDYSISDKLEITKNHLISNIKTEFDINQIDISENDIKYIIEKTDNEAGVRNLKRSIERIISNINLECLLTETSNKHIIIDKSIIDKYLKNNTNDINPSISHLYM